MYAVAYKVIIEYRYIMNRSWRFLFARDESQNAWQYDTTFDPQPE